MSSTQSYINLYLDEYMKFIFKNLEKKNVNFKGQSIVSTQNMEEMKRSLSVEIKKIVNSFVDNFNVNTNKESIGKMNEAMALKLISDPYHQDNLYEIYLNTVKIIVDASSERFLLSFCIDNNMVISIVFDLKEYLKNKNFNILYDAYTSSEDNYYIKADSNYALFYSKETYDQIKSLPEEQSELRKHDNIWYIGDDIEDSFFGLMSELNQYINTDGNSKIHRKW